MLTHKNQQIKKAMGPAFCIWLKRHRENHGLTQEQMARAFMAAVRSCVDLEPGDSFPSGLPHNHPEGIKGAEATASAIYLARTGKTKSEIKAYIPACLRRRMGLPDSLRHGRVYDREIS